MILAWIVGLIRTRPGRFLGIVAGIALAVCLLADLGVFLQQSAETMTARAISGGSADWQIELVPGADATGVRTSIESAVATSEIETLGYADVAGFEFTSPDGSQSTGGGKAVGLGEKYSTILPFGFRMLAGDSTGAVLLQQTAANLHAGPGETITLHREGLADATVHVTGIVDLKTADTFFQSIGTPPGAAPQAPPDNAVLLPITEWHDLFDPLAKVRPDSVRIQMHVMLDHTLLPTDPNAAYLALSGAGHNLELRVAGSALLANNLAAQLDAARGDALYARVLFLFLGAPGIALCCMLTMTLASSGAERRKRDQSLLRLRGATDVTVLGFTAIEAATMGIAGAAAGVLLAMVTAPLFGLQVLGGARFVWSLAAAIGGIGMAEAALLWPAMATSRQISVAAARQTLGVELSPIWSAIFLDLICLAVAAAVFWQTAASGYQVVLATEGVTAVSVDYVAFLAPVLLWIGAGLLTVRLVRLALKRGRKQVEAVAGIFDRAVAPAVAASLSRQRRMLSLGSAFAALAIAFAVSTALFNTTYQVQARVDALLTNGADVTVSGSATAPAGALAATLRAIQGVDGIALMEHRFAYVGTDLQDLYGIDPGTIGDATTLADSYFSTGDAAAMLQLLQTTPDAALVSDETVSDFQLVLGDTINLRLQGLDGSYRSIPFKFAGVVREFPTAPRDSFIVANAEYVAKATQIASREVVLLRTNAPAAVKVAAVKAVGQSPGIVVSELDDARHVIGSSLTAVDLEGLTRLELTFGALLAAAATGMVLVLGFADRRRVFAILAALGARPGQLLGFISAEAIVILGGGIAFGVVTGWLVAQILVVILQGVFDPPPEVLAVPWGMLAIIALIIVGATAAASATATRQASVDLTRRMKELQ